MKEKNNTIIKEEYLNAIKTLNRAANTPHKISNKKTPEEYAKTVKEVTLPAQVRKIIVEYNDTVGYRDEFVWKWIYQLFNKFTLSCVPEQDCEQAKANKTLLTIFITTLDDLAEQKDNNLFTQARSIPFTNNTSNNEIIEFICTVWNLFESNIQNTPLYEDFEQLFLFDLRQSINSMAYSQLVNSIPSMANRKEAERFDAYNMVVFPYACVDLMYSLDFNRSELSSLRRLLCQLQQMARIGNWVTTWEREVSERDISSGIISYSLENNIISMDDFSDSEQVINTIREHRVEELFVREWQILSEAVRQQNNNLCSIDAQELIDGFEIVMLHHLLSRGYK